MVEGAKNRATGASLGSRIGHLPTDHLFEAGLLQNSVEPTTADEPVRLVTVAGLIMFGSDRAIRSQFPLAETVLIDETSVARPTSSSSWLNIVAALPYFTARIAELLK